MFDLLFEILTRLRNEKDNIMGVTEFDHLGLC